MKRVTMFVLFCALGVGAAACQREKPPVPTPTLSLQAVLPASLTETPVSVPSVAALGTAQPTLPPNFVATAGPPPLTLATPTARSASIPPSVQPTSPPPVQPTASSPAVPPGPPSGGCSNPYIVGRGEWAYQIARKCGTTYNALQAANPSVNLAVVYPGQRLNMPGGTPGGTTGGRTYVVQAGDTLYSIATRFGTTAYAIQIRNRLPNPNFIYVGQTLVIP